MAHVDSADQADKRRTIILLQSIRRDCDTYKTKLRSGEPLTQIQLRGGEFPIELELHPRSFWQKVTGNRLFENLDTLVGYLKESLRLGTDGKSIEDFLKSFFDLEQRIIVAQWAGEAVAEQQQSGGKRSVDDLQKLLDGLNWFHDRYPRPNNDGSPNPLVNNYRAIMEQQLADLTAVLDALQPILTDAELSAAAGEGKTGVKPKKSTAKGEAQVKLIAGLTKHHKYQDGSCLNTEPIGVNELARQADVSQGSASAFFNDKFQGHDKYQVVCRDAGRLAESLKVLNGDIAPHDLYGRRPPNEGRDVDK